MAAMTQQLNYLFRPPAPMPAIDPAKFFDKYRSWQWIKHAILGDYIVVWARKVGSSSTRIHIVDAFAALPGLFHCFVFDVAESWLGPMSIKAMPTSSRRRLAACE